MKYKVSTRSNNKQKYTEKSINSGLITVSEHPFDKAKPEQGKLYRMIFPLDTGTVIGEEADGYLTSSLSSNRHYEFLEEVDIKSLKIKIANTDGKQKGKEILSENIGKVCDLEEIGDHEKYKYIVTIDGEKIALSADNCVFLDDDMIGEQNYDVIGKVIKYYGTLLECIDVYDDGLQRYYKSRCVYTGNNIYVPITKPTVVDEVKKIISTESTIDYLKRKGIVHGKSNRETEIGGYMQVDTKTGSSLLFPRRGGYTIGVRALMFKKDEDKFNEAIKDKYILGDNGILFVDPKLTKSLKEYCYFPDNNRRANRRIGRMNI